MGYCGRKRRRKGTVSASGQQQLSMGPMSTPHAFCNVDHELVHLKDIGLKRGRCALSSACTRGGGGGGHTVFGCGTCRVRLCKTGCFAKFHSEQNC